jgi:glycine C-acetyltransferase
MRTALLADLAQRTDGLRDDGLFKAERVIASPQTAHITLADGSQVLNLCANNYLGLADHPRLVQAAHEALDRYGYGMASVRFICGTQTVHTALESALSDFLGTEDTILYSSCFDANGGLFETLLDEQDCVISDALNHASIIDGIRLCKARRMRYDNNDMAQLEQCLRAAAAARYRLIATDGVFSMDGVIADLRSICDLAERYDALVMVDDSHAVGIVGDGGRGTPEYCGVTDRVDIVTGTLGKALGGASGGYTSGRREIIDWLRQRSRPYLFSNSLAPTIAATTLGVLEMLASGDELQRQLQRNSSRFRAGMEAAGFTLAGAGHAIVPVMLGDAKVAGEMAERLLARGIYVIAFSFPVVPQGKARIRTQMSAAHSDEDVDRAVSAFTEVAGEMGMELGGASR